MKKGLTPRVLDALENRLKDGIRFTKDLQEKEEIHISVANLRTTKTPLVACILSLIPGVGHIYLGQNKKGLLMLITAYPLFIITIPFGIIDVYILDKRIRNGNKITPWECFWTRRKIEKII